jgi:D-alanine-D-alanine ligase
MTSEEIKNKRIAVLRGGLSAERDVSLRTGAAVLKALRESGYSVIDIDAGRDLAERLRQEGAEVAFIALHGRFGEDGTVQGLLELLGIPYTGSGVLASALAMDKVTTKQVLIYHGLATPAFATFRQGDDPQTVGWRSWPAIVKPAREGSTIGVGIVRSAEELPAALAAALLHDSTVLIEEFIEGMEVTVGVLDGEALPIIQVVPKGGFYDYHAKYTAGQTEYILPAPLPASIYRKLQDAAATAFHAVGCAGAARVDFMVRGDEFFCLEVNTIPGMTETSLLPKAARQAGISFEQLTQRILAGAGIGK